MPMGNAAEWQRHQKWLLRHLHHPFNYDAFYYDIDTPVAPISQHVKG